jgi:kynurenine formamidase
VPNSDAVTQIGAANFLDFFRNITVVDLSVLVSEELPGTWPTVTPYHAMLVNWYTDWRGPCYTRLLSIEEHVGTHCDAPAHFIPHEKHGLPHSTPYGGVTVEQLELEQFMGPAAVIDVTHLTDTGEPGQSPIISIDDIRQWEEQHGKISPGDVVLLRTDWTDRHYRKAPEGNRFAYDPIIAKSAPAWPAPDAETMTYLVDQGVRCVGIDNNSMGPLQADAEPHWAGLGRGTVFVERMTNLRLLPPRGALFLFLPIKIEGGSGAPGRAIGLVPRK